MDVNPPFVSSSKVISRRHFILETRSPAKSFLSLPLTSASALLRSSSLESATRIRHLSLAFAHASSTPRATFASSASNNTWTSATRERGPLRLSFRSGRTRVTKSLSCFLFVTTRLHVQSSTQQLQPRFRRSCTSAILFRRKAPRLCGWKCQVLSLCGGRQRAGRGTFPLPASSFPSDSGRPAQSTSRRVPARPVASFQRKSNWSPVLRLAF